MSCFCSLPLNGLMSSLNLIPPLGHLVPSISTNLSASLGLGLGFNPASSLSASATAQAAATANLSAMASLSAALQAAMGMNLAAALSAQASASAQARMAASINGFNANAGNLNFDPAFLRELLNRLLGLLNLSGLLLAIKAAFRIDMRASGAIPALQARLAAMASVNATVSANAGLKLSAMASLMAALGLKANAQGALTANAQAQALASMMAGLPAIGSGFNLMALLNAVLAMLDAIRNALGVNLLSPSAMVDLRASLSLLPLAALAQLSATAAVTANASAALAANASAAANAATALDLSGVASANLSAVGSVAMLLDVMAKGGLGMPAGSCGLPCPLALLENGPALPALSATSGSAASGTVH